MGLKLRSGIVAHPDRIVLTSNRLRDCSRREVQSIEEYMEERIAVNLEISDSFIIQSIQISYRPYACSLCYPVGEFTYHRIEQLIDHLAKMHKVDGRDHLKKGDDFRGFACKNCIERFRTWDQLRGHINRKVPCRRWYQVTEEAEERRLLD